MCMGIVRPVSCASPGEKDWGEAGGLAWVEWGRDSNARLKRLISSAGGWTNC